MGPRERIGVSLVAFAVLCAPVVFSQARPVLPPPMPQVPRPVPPVPPWRPPPPVDLPRPDLPRPDVPRPYPDVPRPGDPRPGESVSSPTGTGELRTEAELARDEQYVQAASELRSFAVQSRSTLPTVRKLRRIGSR